MSESEGSLYYQNPLYQDALSKFQRGEWEAGLSLLNRLVEQYPLEQSLRFMRQEMQLRAKIDQDEIKESKTEILQKILIWEIRLAVVLIVLGLIAWGISSYSSWLHNQWEAARQSVGQQVELLDLSIKFRNAQNLLQASRPEEAKALLNDIVSVDPGFPGLDTLQTQTDNLIKIQSSYNEAIQLLDKGDYPAALVILEDISSQDPNYKDVQIRLDHIKKDFLLEESFKKAEKAFVDNNWEDAILWYENVRTSDPEYRADYIEEQLFNSYISVAEEALAKPTNTIQDLEHAEAYFQKALGLHPRDPNILAKRAQARNELADRLVNNYMKAAQSALVGQADSIIALQEAEKYFNQAFALHPGDSEIAQQLDFAQKYLRAIENFAKGLWDDVIEDLEIIYQDDKNYADGTAQQTLYQAYTMRGNMSLAVGEYQQALADFQHAAQIAQQSPASTLRLFEVQLKIADTKGLLGSYLEAVQIYQAAIDLGGLRSLAAQKKSKLSVTLSKANALVEMGDYKEAYQVYSVGLHDISDLYTITDVTVVNGDYLTMLARRYNSTVEAIMVANNLEDQNNLKPNTKLHIPHLP